MKFSALALVLLLGVACEKKPTEEEVQQEQKKAAEAAKATPKPKAGDWMWKDKERANPLEKKKH